MTSPEPISAYKKIWLCAFAVVQGIPLAAVGLVLCATIVGIPIGVPILFLSGRPLAKAMKRKVKPRA